MHKVIPKIQQTGQRHEEKIFCSTYAILRRFEQMFKKKYKYLKIFVGVLNITFTSKFKSKILRKNYPPLE